MKLSDLNPIKKPVVESAMSEIHQSLDDRGFEDYEMDDVLAFAHRQKEFDDLPENTQVKIEAAWDDFEGYPNKTDVEKIRAAILKDLK